jgi:hypothetical protein
MHRAIRPRSVLLSILLAAVLTNVSFGAAPVGAAGTSFHEPYSFTLTPAQCPELPAAISDEDEYFVRIKERTDRNGVIHTTINVTASGTATDADGNTYRYSYLNRHDVTTQPGGFPSVEVITDHFALAGRRGAVRLRVDFVLRLTFAAEGESPTEEWLSLRGNPNCDPI